MSNNKAPSFGTKVDLGENAPVRAEGAGTVLSESLAAESYREGGDFASNRDAQPENMSSSGSYESASRTANTGSGNASSGSTEPRSFGGTAPSYVENQYIKDSSGPHGRNLTEGGWDESKIEDGIQKSFNAELGSKNDPARVAEQQMELNNNAQSRAAGPKQSELTNKTPYDALGSNVNA